jgi:hypothetical protein
MNYYGGVDFVNGTKYDYRWYIDPFYGNHNKLFYEFESFYSKINYSVEMAGKHNEILKLAHEKWKWARPQFLRETRKTLPWKLVLMDKNYYERV